MYNSIMGGGILPIAFYKGHPYFLFSREGMIQAEDPGKWSDFGGSKEKNETPKMTAIRDMYDDVYETNRSSKMMKRKDFIQLEDYANDVNNLDDTYYQAAINYIEAVYESTSPDYLDGIRGGGIGSVLMKLAPALITGGVSLFDKIFGNANKAKENSNNNKKTSLKKEFVERELAKPGLSPEQRAKFIAMLN